MTPRLGDRSLFPDLQPRIFLAHAAVSPLSTPVVAAVNHAVQDTARLGVAAVGPWMERREATRARVAAWIGSEPDNIGFSPGTTRGIVDIALAIPWRTGDRILVFDGEFPSNVRPWLTVAQRFGATVQSLPIEGFGDYSGTGLERVQAALKQGGVRLIAVSAVQFQTGLRMPLKALADLAHAHGAELFVDAIQSLGVVPTDVGALGIDYLVAGTHKWLMGLDGLAIVHASPASRERLTPLTAGWLSCEEPLGFLFDAVPLPYTHPLRKRMDWVEGGVQTTAAFAALDATVALLDTLKQQPIYDHVQAWHDTLEPHLLELGFVSARAANPEARSGTLSVRPPVGAPSVPELAKALNAQGIAVTTPDGWLRLAPHWPNAIDEAWAVLEAIRAWMPPRS